MERYVIDLEETKNQFTIFAKNKTDARKKAKKRLANNKANRYVKIYGIEESIL